MPKGVKDLLAEVNAVVPTTRFGNVRRSQKPVSRRRIPEGHEPSHWIAPQTLSLGGKYPARHGLGADRQRKPTVGFRRVADLNIQDEGLCGKVGTRSISSGLRIDLGRRSPEILDWEAVSLEAVSLKDTTFTFEGETFCLGRPDCQCRGRDPTQGLEFAFLSFLVRAG